MSPQPKRIQANMSITVFEKDKQEANPLKELNETLGKLEKQKQELEKKVRAENQKAQKFTAAAERENKALQIPKLPYNRYALKKCVEKKGRLQKKIDKLRGFNFCVENQITLLEGRAKAEGKPVYDDSPIHEKSAFKSIDMTMNNDELRETIDEINKDIEYMQLKSSEKLGRRCRHVMIKPFVSIKNSFGKLFLSEKLTRSN
ncbi:hypothetical protein M0R45_024048 [Rubus argutus]|uniref:Uncharacterized protein n=1 Tax=Rubus argutus TaxID=59490 RepID=A0AAW1WRY7_RUBAR